MRLSGISDTIGLSLRLCLDLGFPIIRAHVASSTEDLQTRRRHQIQKSMRTLNTFEEQIGSAGNAASAQCSATQDGNSVVISCDDGSSAVLAGAGTVVTYPEGGVIGGIPHSDLVYLQSRLKKTRTSNLCLPDSRRQL